MLIDEPSTALVLLAVAYGIALLALPFVVMVKLCQIEKHLRPTRPNPEPLPAATKSTHSPHGN